MLSVRFWGVRGSIPCPGPDTVIFGGNTSCIEIRADERLIIVDLGTGIRPLGSWLKENDLKKHGKISADIFVSHSHWDHIMGFPSFSPIYIPNTTLRIHGPVSSGEDCLENIIRTQLSYRYWPVRLDELSANIEFRQIGETTLDLGGGLTVTSKYMNHPILCLGYRFNYKGKSIAAVFDHEPFNNFFHTDPSKAPCDENEIGIAAARENEKIIRFMENVDILIHDAQYSEAEYADKVGWGHGSCKDAIDCAVGANAKKLVFFHYDPIHTDKHLQQVFKTYSKKAPVKIFMAKEGMTLQA